MRTGSQIKEQTTWPATKKIERRKMMALAAAETQTKKSGTLRAPARETQK
jgi:hypothetical protein